MVKKLVIQISDNTNVLASCYYNWYGHTEKSIEITKGIIQHLIWTQNKDLSNLERAVSALAFSGGSINFDTLLNFIEKNSNLDSNIENLYIKYSKVIPNSYFGIIAIDLKSLIQQESCTRKTIRIDLINNTIDFNVYIRVKPTDIPIDEHYRRYTYNNLLNTYKDIIKQFKQKSFKNITFNDFLDFENSIWDYKHYLLHDLENKIIMYNTDMF